MAVGKEDIRRERDRDKTKKSSRKRYFGLRALFDEQCNQINANMSMTSARETLRGGAIFQLWYMAAVHAS